MHGARRANDQGLSPGDLRLLGTVHHNDVLAQHVALRLKQQRSVQNNQRRALPHAVLDNLP
jgi:hypothetical protein